MGDENRAAIFTEFIRKQFPKVQTVCCVADGKGHLARKLANKGFRVIVYEPKPRFEGSPHKLICYYKKEFSRDTDVQADLIVGMHPDEATAEILLSAKRQGKPWAIVPCCIKGVEAIGVPSKFDVWVAKLKKLADYKCQEYVLKMNGKNLCLYSK